LPDGSSSCGHRADPLAVFVWMSALTQPESIRKSFLTCAYTVYLERAVPARREQGGAVDEALLKHVAPVHWNHIILTGDYNWRQNRRVEKGDFGRCVPPVRRLSVLWRPFRRTPPNTMPRG